MRRFYTLLVLGALTLALTPATRAQGTRGFMLNGRLLGAAVSVNPEEGDSETEAGAGLGLRVGYGFNERITLYFGVDGAAIEPEEGGDLLENGTYGLGTADLGVRFNFPAGRSIVPYAEAALTGQALVFDFEGTDTNLNVSGGGLTVGGGAQFFVSRTLAIDAGLDFTFGKFTQAETDGPGPDVSEDLEDAGSVITRVGVGLSFYPSRNR